MTLICENCNDEFEAKRKTARYCSDSCRVEAARKIKSASKRFGKPVDIDKGEVVFTLSPGGLAPTRVDRGKPGDDKTIVQQHTPKGDNPFLQEYPKTATEAVAYDKDAALAAFKKMGMVEVNWITTGIPELDAFQQIPRGRITQIQGPYAVGKTTLALNMIRGLKDKKVFYVDSEASLNPWLLVELQLNPKNFHLYNESAYIEDIYEKVVQAAKSGKYDIIILDSLAACTSKTEADGNASDRNIGHKALIVNKLMRIVPMELKNTDTALVIINQEREVIGSYVPQKYTPGGMGPLYSASLILGLKTIPSWRFPKGAKDGAFTGHEIEVTILKSKVSRPHRKAKIKLYYLNPELEGKGHDALLADTEAF